MNFIGFVNINNKSDREYFPITSITAVKYDEKDGEQFIKFYVKSCTSAVILCYTLKFLPYQTMELTELDELVGKIYSQNNMFIYSSKEISGYVKI